MASILLNHYRERIMAIEMLPVKTFNGWKRFLESQEGFTLVEMITVVAIMGIILAVAVPNISIWKEKHQIDSIQIIFFVVMH